MSVNVAVPEEFLDEPEEGWPWQLKHCWVLDKQGTGNSVKYKVKCKCCAWSPGYTHRYRVGFHYRAVKGSHRRQRRGLTLWRAQVRA